MPFLCISSFHTPEKASRALSYWRMAIDCSLVDRAGGSVQSCVPSLEMWLPCWGAWGAPFPGRRHKGTPGDVVHALWLSWCCVLTGILPKKVWLWRIKAPLWIALTRKLILSVGMISLTFHLWVVLWKWKHHMLCNFKHGGFSLFSFSSQNYKNQDNFKHPCWVR